MTSNGDSDSFLWVVSREEARMRLDRFLAAREDLGTRSQIQRLITDRRVWVRGRRAKPATLLRVGDTVRVERPRLRPRTLQPEAMDLEVLFEDDVLLAINKPAGLVVHPAPGHWEGTLVHALLHRWGAAESRLDEERLGIVHRLDKDTSGVLLIAKDPRTLEALARQFRLRQVEKRYVALAHGRVRADQGVVREAIGRHPVHRKRMAVRSGGRTALTRYQVIERFAAATFLRLFPETGRTHQIRVHLAAMGHPIVADATYGRSRGRGPELLGRHALHAETVSFRHPLSGREMTLSAPLPEDISRALVELRREAEQRRFP
jgi:23S rRNA pseudouridine1911/1915/1917 synthase